MTVRLSPVRRAGAVGVAGAAALLVAGLGTPAHAVGYADPTISLSATRLTGVVGAHDGPAVTVDVEQSGVPAGFLRLRVLSSSNPAVAAVGDVRQQRTPSGDRSLTVRPRGQGHTDLTLQVTGRGGKTATATLAYAASAGKEAKDLDRAEGQKSRSARIALGPTRGGHR